MSIEAELREEYERRERRELSMINALPYVLLGFSTLIALLQPLWDHPVHLPALVGLVLTTLLWVAWFTSLHPHWQDEARLMGLYYTGLLTLSAGLVALTPFYSIFAFIGYVHALRYLGGVWVYVGVVANAMIMAVGHVGGLRNIIDDGEWWLWAVISLVTAVLASTFIYFADISYRHSGRQKQALAELHEANLRLEEALTENAELHAQLVNQARRGGVLDERQRMAAEIHDTLAQSLAGILAQLQAAEQTMGESETPRAHVAAAEDLARSSLVEARRTVQAVKPEVLEAARLPEAISEVVAVWGRRHDVDAALVTTGEPRPLYAEAEIALLRTAQEALANVAKHAEASTVRLTLSYMEEQVTLDVRDDGVGFSPGPPRSQENDDAGFGLLGMRRRLQRLAGWVSVESEPGGGTAVSASVPAAPVGSDA